VDHSKIMHYIEMIVFNWSTVMIGPSSVILIASNFILSDVFHWNKSGKK
jgi:hypothetical protein